MKTKYNKIVRKMQQSIIKKIKHGYFTRFKRLTILIYKKNPNFKFKNSYSACVQHFRKLK